MDRRFPRASPLKQWVHPDGGVSMTSVFSIRRATGLFFSAALSLWLMAAHGAAQALPPSALEASGGSFLRFSLADPVDHRDGSATADFLLLDGDRPVSAAEIDVSAALCLCRVGEECYVLSLPLAARDGNAVFRLVLPRAASCNIIVKLRYRGARYVVQTLRRIYARGRDPADWGEAAALPAAVPYVEAAEESYNFRTGQPMAFTFRQGGSPATVAVYDKARRLLETLTVRDGFSYEVTPLPPLTVPGRGSREDVFFAARLAEGGEPLHLFAQVGVVHDRRLYLQIPHGVVVFFLAGGVTAAVILMRRRRRGA